MSHEFDSGVFGNNLPAWHGLGKVLVHCPTTEEALREGGLLWDVEKQPIYRQTADGRFEVIPEQFESVRRDRDGHLGVVGNKYSPIQNVQAFSFIDTLLQDRVARWETAISLRDGRLVCGVLSLNETGVEIRKGDTLYPFLFVVNTHDGSGSAKVFPSFVRGVCANTVRLALQRRDKGYTVNIRHSGTIANKVAEAQRITALWGEDFTLGAEWLHRLVERPASKDRVAEFLDAMFPVSEAEKQGSGRSKTIRENQTLALAAAIQQEIVLLPQYAASTQASAYDVFNGLTRFIDHDRANRDSVNRFEYAVLGGGEDIKERGIHIIAQMFDAPLKVAK